MEVLLVLGVVLLLITLIGHGIWVLCAWLLRGGKPKRATASTVCRQCKTWTSQYPCHHCGYAPNADANVERTLRRLVNKGLLEAEVMRRVEAALQAEGGATVGREQPVVATAQLQEMPQARRAQPAVPLREAMLQEAPCDPTWAMASC